LIPLPSATKRREHERVVRRRHLRSVAIGVAVAVVLAVVFVVAALLGGEGGPSPTGALPAETGTVSVQGRALPDFPESGQDQAIGQTAPDLSGSSFDGTPVEITNDGTPKVIVFLAHWCPHCQAEVPRIVSMQERGALPADVRIYAVSTGVNPAYVNYPPSAWLARERWTNPVLRDNETGSAARAYGLTGYPMIVFVDARGAVVARVSGEQEDAAIIGLMQQLASSSG
jgi:cytochrome c biogenesis protein CcmG, thiol:disulfide interchange protein DsbE